MRFWTRLDEDPHAWAAFQSLIVVVVAGLMGFCIHVCYYAIHPWAVAGANQLIGIWIASRLVRIEAEARREIRDQDREIVPGLQRCADFAQQPRPIPSGTAVLLTEGDYVWVCERRRCSFLNGHYQFAGGKVDPFENPIQAAKREVQEETGLNIPRDRFLTLGRAVTDPGLDTEMLVYFYEVRLLDGEVPAWVETEKHGPWEKVHAREMFDRRCLTGFFSDPVTEWRTRVCPELRDGTTRDR